MLHVFMVTTTWKPTQLVDMRGFSTFEKAQEHTGRSDFSSHEPVYPDPDWEAWIDSDHRFIIMKVQIDRDQS